MLTDLPSLARVVVARVLAAGLGAVAGYHHGLDTERGRHALAMQAAIVAADEAAREDAAAESKRREAAALRDAHAAAAARAARLTGQRHALQTDRPDCRWPAERRLHLNAAVAVANLGADAAPGSLPAPLPRVAEPAR